MFLAITEDNVVAALKAAPDKKLAYAELLQKFGNHVELLALLWRMRGDSRRPLRFSNGWIDVSEIVVYLKE